MSPPQAREFSTFDITSQAFWSQPFAVRDETFAQLRASEGLTWHRPMSSLFAMAEDGFWALTRRADIAFARAGDKVGLFYCSANRDESVFDEPGEFDLGRSPNPHLGFGGGGPHFCLGNQLARAELRNLFRELLSRLTRVEFGEPDLLYSSFVHGIKRLPAHVR
jgi:hypothetical protein